MTTNKIIPVAVIVVIVLVIIGGGYFVFFQDNGENAKNIFSSKTFDKEVSELIFDLTELPEGFQIAERTPRLKSDVSEEGINLGWKEGYLIKYTKGEGIFDISVIELYTSRYPVENISKVIEPVQQIEGYLFEELPNPNIGETSIAIRYTDDEFGLRTYWIQFTKKDIYVSLTMSGTATDYELIKELAKKM